ncbi:MAG: type II toxin-antitoxin system Phd/YefM family antitoxin [Myxococcaceae bacterium]
MTKKPNRQALHVTTSELKTHCSELVTRVGRRRESIVVTRRGRPVARLSPIEAEATPLFGFASGAIQIRGDVLAPVDVRWDADEQT